MFSSHVLGLQWEGDAPSGIRVGCGEKEEEVSQVLRVSGFLREGMLRGPKSSSSTPTPATLLSESEQESKLSW